MLTIEHRGPAGARPDPNVWRTVVGDVPNELQSYTAQGNAFTDGAGHLVLEARKESTLAPYGNGVPRGYSSARLDTEGILKVQPGSLVEFDALLPSDPGCFPALWFVGSNQATVGYAAAGELDVVEVAGGWRPDTVLLNAHAAYYDAQLDRMGAAQTPPTTGADLKARGVHYQTGWQASTWRDVTDPATGALEPVGARWRRFGAHFDGNGIRWYLDGRVVMTRTKAQFDALGVQWPWNKPMRMIVNLAVGSAGGAPVPDADGTWVRRMLLGPIRISQPGEVTL